MITKKMNDSTLKSEAYKIRLKQTDLVGLVAWWRNGYLQIFTQAFLLILAPAGGSNPTVDHLPLPNQTYNNLPKATVKI